MPPLSALAPYSKVRKGGQKSEDTMPFLPTGKLPADLLRSLLATHAIRDPRVVVGARVGEDAAVIDLGDRYLVAAADPITFATDELGWYAVADQRQ